MSNQLAVFDKPADMMAYLQKGKSAVEMALPKHLNADRMLRLALTAFSTTPALRKCSAQSILASIVVASQIGLEPGVAGQAYLIPYGTQCTFVPGWQGLVGLLNNSGRATAWTGVVFDGDQFDFRLGANPKLDHIPGPNFGDPDKMQWAYAIGKVNGSEMPVIEAWPIARVWKHRDKFNKVGSRHYSFQHPEMYARKVVLLQVLKYMPRSIELNNAIVASDAAEMGRTSRVEDGIVIDVQTDAPAIATARVGARKQLEDEQPMTPTEEAAASAILDGVSSTETAPEPEKPKAKAKPAPAPEPQGPTVEELRKGILTELAKFNIGKTRLMGHLHDLEEVMPSVSWDQLGVLQLQVIANSIGLYIDQIKAE